MKKQKTHYILLTQKYIYWSILHAVSYIILMAPSSIPSGDICQQCLLYKYEWERMVSYSTYLKRPKYWYSRQLWPYVIPVSTACTRLSVRSITKVWRYRYALEGRCLQMKWRGKIPINSCRFAGIFVWNWWIVYNISDKLSTHFCSLFALVIALILRFLEDSCDIFTHSLPCCFIGVIGKSPHSSSPGMNK